MSGNAHSEQPPHESWPQVLCPFWNSMAAWLSMRIWGGKEGVTSQKTCCSKLIHSNPFPPFSALVLPRLCQIPLQVLLANGSKAMLTEQVKKLFCCVLAWWGQPVSTSVNWYQPVSPLNLKRLGIPLKEWSKPKSQGERPQILCHFAPGDSACSCFPIRL